MILRSITFKAKIIPCLVVSNSYKPICRISSQSSNSKFISLYSKLLDDSVSLKSLVSAKCVHAHFIKLGLGNHTFLGNRLLDFYTKFGTIEDVEQVFDEIQMKNLFTCNIMLMGLFKFGYVEEAHVLFEEMHERDVVSWNSMISGFASYGYVASALGVFSEMQNVGIKPSAFTFSIAISCILSACHGKQVHGSIIRSGLNSSNVVLCNCLIDMYGKLGLVNYALDVFLTMEEWDVISWNSLILGCLRSDDEELAMYQFCSMRSAGYTPDEFTMSTVVTVCSNLCGFEKGKQVFVLCIKMGFLSNSIVSSACIDMFSKYNRLEDSVRIFEEMYRWDSALYNSMISSYVRNGFVEEALELFVETLRANIIPTEFTLSNMLTSASYLVPSNHGTQIHAMVLKLGFESYTIVASSLVHVYAKSGLVDSAMEVFTKMGIKDLVSWNTMIMCFARNGQGLEALKFFEELLDQGVLPDRITLFGVLLACCYGGLMDEGWMIFSLMEQKYGIVPGVEHYACLVDMMCRMGKFIEAIQIIERMPHEPDASILGLLLHASKIQGDLKLTEGIAERLMEFKPQYALPYIVLAQAYEAEGRWESVVRVRRAMKDTGVGKARGCSWIRIKNQVFAFKEPNIALWRRDLYNFGIAGSGDGG